jgi:ATP-binding cassette subfamily B protein
VVIDHGAIVEMGSHEELVSRGGHYAAMYATWISQSATHGDTHAP